jgi:hypothetical protein
MLEPIDEWLNQVNGQREDDRRVFLNSDLGERLQVAQLQGIRL